MRQSRTPRRHWRFIAFPFVVILTFGLLVAYFDPQVAYARGPQLTVDGTGIRTTTPLTVSKSQTVTIINVAAVTVSISGDGAGSVIENGNTTQLAASPDISLDAGQTVTLKFTQPGVYHFTSSGTTGGTETITVIP